VETKTEKNRRRKKNPGKFQFRSYQSVALKIALASFFLTINLISGWILAQAIQKNETSENPNSRVNPDLENFIPELDSPDPENPGQNSEIETPLPHKDEPEINIQIYGGDTLNLKFGKSFYVSDKDRLNSPLPAFSPAVVNGLNPDMDFKMNLEGNIGKQLNINTNFDQKEILSNNQIHIIYTPADENSPFKKMEIGNLDFDFSRSRLIYFNKQSFRALGMESTLQFDKFKIKAIGALNESQSETEIFDGQRKHKIVFIDEYRYLRRKYYQLEPFLYYDRMTSMPASISSAAYQRGNAAALNIFTSTTPVTSPPPVDVDPSSVEIFLDSGNTRINSSMRATPKYVNGNFLGNYYRLREGRDFTIHYASGRINFVVPLGISSKAFVRYTRNKGSTSTSDPGARIVSGKIETFIKFATAMNEDSLRNGVVSFNGFDDVEIIRDGMVNLDVYEVRGVYDLQGTDIDQTGFHLELSSPSFQMIPGIDTLGYYKINYVEGTLEFGSREPFRNLQNNGKYIIQDSDISSIYSENQSVNIFENSNVQLKAEFTAHQRSIQLKHMNIVPSSEIVRINGIRVPPESYFLDYLSGYFVFLNKDSIFNNNLSKIEIHYNYLPFGQLKESYLVGTRVEYKPFQEITLGASAYYNGDFQPSAMDYVGNEPHGLFVTGTDLHIDADESSLTSMTNKILQTSYEKVPVTFHSFGEYAQSFYNVNTMGMALIDNMESSEINLDVSLNAGEWILSSIPPSLTSATQCNRAPLYYKYYYDPKNYQYGLLSYDSKPTASPPYSQLAGPYNVLYGHLNPNQINIQNNQIQKSMTLDFDFSRAPDNANPFIGIQTKLSGDDQDFSGFTELNFSALLENISGLDSGISLIMDVGSVNEDTDGSGKMKTEDIGLDHLDGDTNGNGIQDAGEHWDTGERNHVIDFDRTTGGTEDIGYPFNPPTCPAAATKVGAGPDISGYPSTIGNGVLNSEDTNDNGQMDTTDNVIHIDPSNPAIRFDSGSNVILPGGWKQYKIFINPALLGEREKSVLKRVESIRIYAVPAGAARGKGKIFIDQIRFSGSLWKNKKEKTAGGIESPLTNPATLYVSNIDNFNSKDEYEAESFLLKKRAEYENLYGKKSNNEIYTLKEGSLKLSYTLDPALDYALVERIFPKSMDISLYKYINIWVNHRSYNASGGKIFFRIGNDTHNYKEFESSIDRKDWQKLRFDLNKPNTYIGNPNSRVIKYLSIGIKNSSGTVRNGITWVDDIYVSDTIITSDNAFAYGAGFEVSKPFFKTKSGIPVFSDFRADYYRIFKNYQYHSIAETGQPYLENQNNLVVQTKIFPSWAASYTLNDYKSDMLPTDISSDKYHQGTFARTLHSMRSDFFNDLPEAPHILLALNYSKDGTNINNSPTITDGTFSREQFRNNYEPNIEISQKISDIFKIINISYDMNASTTFFNTQIRETSTESTGTSVLRTSEKDQWQHSMEMFHISLVNLGITASHENAEALLVQRNYTDYTVLSQVNGDYYFPFFGKPSDFRLQQRNNSVMLDVGYDHLKIFLPKITMSMKYNEDSFRDNTTRFNSDIFQRYKNSHALTSLNLSLPLFFSGRKDTGDKKMEQKKEEESNFNASNSLSLNFRREIQLQEFSVPFTANATLANDAYGMNRIFPGLMAWTFDLARYPFWYYFLSPPNTGVNFYNGRQFVGSQNLSITNAGDYSSLYDNSLGLTEIASINSHLNITRSISLNMDSRLSQNALRSFIYAALMQEADFAYSFSFLFNLMDLLDFGFWKNKSNNSILSLGFTHDIHMLLTSNVEETILTPDTSIQFKWLDEKLNTLNGVTLHLLAGFHSFKKHQYLTDLGMDPALNDQPGNIMELYSIQNSINYNISIEMFTELPGLKKLLEGIIHNKIDHNPRYSITLGADLNDRQISYFNMIQTPLLDEYIMKHSLDMNLHKNVTGILDLMFVYDIRKRADTDQLISEVFSVQAGVTVKILF